MTYAYIEAEHAILGSILLEGDLIAQCTLQPEQFSTTIHQVLFKSFRDLDDKGDRIDVITVVTELNDVMEQIGGVSFLTKLVDSVPSTSNFSFYEQKVKEAYVIRETNKIGNVLSSLTDEDQIRTVYQQLAELQDGKAASNRSKQEIFQEVFHDISTPTYGLTGIDTGIAALNKLTGGLQKGDLVVIGARPSMGKTAFALQLSRSHCQTGGVTTIFSCEMSDVSLMKRMLSATARVNGAKWRQPYETFTADDHERMAKAIGEIEAWDIHIYDRPAQTVFDIRAAIRKAMREHPDQPHLFVIDYLQLMKPVGKFERHDLAIGSITKKLKEFAREYNVPIVLLSQLNRGVEQRQDKRPHLSDIRDSGDIEQDADVVAFLYRDDYYNRDSDHKDETELIVSKQRNGPVGTIHMTFKKEYGQFFDRKSKKEGKENHEKSIS
ncbi:replicative DNA helicase [Metabacillus iocasae]|uniref:Replicative DNA helicase n=1 Tax=Priestia iocasae TaxID=2291674 RepID=A0ABS2QV16_9BACI|nr:replicative DNA helicase [Metabacillus iocasae]MBM7702319.1 replicative DNA helicase [Metabacillus iocasae]